MSEHGLYMTCRRLATTGLGVQLQDEFEVVDIADAAHGAAADAWGDPLSGNQWDMVQIHVPEAHEIISGSPSIVVGDIDTSIQYTHPYLFNCRNDATQRAIWKAEQRAIRYAMSQGVAVVAAQGNENIDLSKRNFDDTSPDYPPGNEVDREVTNACVVIPVEIPGVIGVTANGNLMQKSYYSSYGVGVVQVVAPGGDSRFQRTTDAPRGTVYSTYPTNRYAYAQGTLMASPHAAGVAALIVSQFGKMPQGKLQAYLTSTADPQACPENPFNPGPPYNYTAYCFGGVGYNGFYGHGQVNAFNAVTHTP